MKLFIKNRKGQNVCVLVDKAESQKGLAFVMHGHGGFKEQKHIETFADAFKDSSYTVVRFDTTNTFGESDGNYEDSTVTNYYEDLEDVIFWAHKQDFYQEPFALAGHSIGGMCVTLFAEKYPEKISTLAPISASISGKLSLKAMDKDKLEEWKKTGFRIQESKSKPGIIKRDRWAYMEDKLKYDLLPDAKKLKMPVLLIVGENDHTPHQKIFYDKIPGKKELHIIKGAGHNFREKEHLEEIKMIISNWIKIL